MPVDVLEHVLGALLEGVLVVDAGGKRVYANEEAARLTGYPSVAALLEAPPEEAAARFDIRDRSGRPIAAADLPGRRVLAGAETRPMLVRFSSGDGPERISEIRSVAVRGDDGANAYVITYFREVTEQVVEVDRVEALYLHAEQTTALLDALYESAPVGLGFWDRELRYVRVNDALARINERSAEDHVGRTFHEVVPQLADELEAIARGVLETGEAVIGLEIAAGTPRSPEVVRYWSASYYPVNGPDGEPIGVGAVVEETTDRRRAEQRERTARAEAEAAAATLRKLERVSQAALEHLSLQDLLDALLDASSRCSRPTLRRSCSWRPTGNCMCERPPAASGGTARWGSRSEKGWRAGTRRAGRRSSSPTCRRSRSTARRCAIVGSTRSSPSRSWSRTA